MLQTLFPNEQSKDFQRACNSRHQRHSWMWMAGLMLSLFLFGCGAKAFPCASDSDCLQKEFCRDGFCQEGTKDIKKKPSEGLEVETEAGPSDEEVTEDTDDAGEPIDGTDETVPEPDENDAGEVDNTPKPPTCTGSANCMRQGICQNVKVSCVGVVWKCEYPSDFEKEESSCDGKDNDCDGTVDEGCNCQVGKTRPCGSGVGECVKGTQTCTAAGRWGACAGETQPVAEVCDGKDNDCDGQTDEQLQRACYSGPSGTKQRGSCKAGIQLCRAGVWGSCSGEVLPSTEICDNKDNDCDGMVDEQLQKTCYTGPTQTQGVGTCVSGKQMCRQGRWGRCAGELLPTAEVCDGKDNDCDGTVDENLTKTCYTGPAGSLGKGLCKGGKQTCSAGLWGRCSGEVKPSSEVCDGKDNDCDGLVDERLSRSCYSGPAATKGVGLCKAGRQACASGVWGQCVGEMKPTVEVCDGKDNDCDGAIDEQIVRSCYTGPANTKGIGTCKSGQQRCSAGRWGQCLGEVKPSVEVCDGKDSDCDGRIDEDLRRACYSGPTGTKGVGICRGGTQSCSNGNWSSCQQEVKPAVETCDTKDNDCDGLTDEGSSICSINRVCQRGSCVCDRKKGYYPLGNTCVRDGDTCPASIRRAPYCLDSSHLVMCDPFGKIGVINCPGWTGRGCMKLLGRHGCGAVPAQYLKSACVSFTNGYAPYKKWQAVMTGLGPDKNNAIVSLSACNPNLNHYCGTVVTAAGHQTACMCGERSGHCGNTKVYDPIVYDSTRNTCYAFLGKNYQCSKYGTSYCSKGQVNGFATYSCH